WGWIRGNPQTSLKLVFERFVAYWLPWDEPFPAVITLFSFVGLWLSRWNALVKRLAFALFVIFPLPYYIVEHSLRYRAPTFWFTALLAGTVLFRALEFSGGRTTGASPASTPAAIRE